MSRRGGAPNRRYTIPRLLESESETQRMTLRKQRAQVQRLVRI